MKDRKEQATTLDAALGGMFQALEARGAPEHLRAVVDQLAACEAVMPSPEPPSSPEP